MAVKDPVKSQNNDVRVAAAILSSTRNAQLTSTVTTNFNNVTTAGIDAQQTVKKKKKKKRDYKK